MKKEKKTKKEQEVLDAETLEMIEKMAQCYLNQGVVLYDLVETAKAECEDALKRKYQGRNGAKQATYLYRYAQGAMSRLVGEIDKTPNIPVSVQRYVADKSWEEVEIELMRNELYTTMGKYLTDMEFFILIAVALSDNEEKAKSQFAKQACKSRKYIDKAYYNAKKAIKNCPESMYIYQLLKDIKDMQNSTDVHWAFCEPKRVQY